MNFNVNFCVNPICANFGVFCMLDSDIDKNFESSIAKSLEPINKGLAFELLTTHWLRETDSPKRTQANCLLNKDNKPCDFAPSGNADAFIN